MYAEGDTDEFPTCVGMNRFGLTATLRILGVPHMRGDEPISLLRARSVSWSSPHAWG